jgi:lauroyl/myristoyl acyltransferase
MLKYAILFVVFHVLGRLPRRVLYWIAAIVAETSYRLAPGARRNVWRNLRHVMPAGSPRSRMRETALRVFRNVALYYADLAHLPRMDVRQFYEKRLKVYGLEERLIPAVKSGRGVIILSGHFGNPELVVQALVTQGIHVFALTEPQKPAKISSMMDGIRASKGHEFGPVSVGNVRKVMRTLKNGGVVALMGDRDIHGPKASLPFLGEETMMPTGPIEVALRTGAIVFPCFCFREGSRFRAYIEEPLDLERTGNMDEDVREGTLRFLERLEDRLREDPGQWAVLESVWDGAMEPAPPDPAVVGGRN